MSRRLLDRLALLVVIVGAFVAQPVRAVASAGVQWGRLSCCCPDPSVCPCHDHGDRGGSPAGQADLRRCARDGAVVAPVLAAAITVDVAAPRLVAPAAMTVPAAPATAPPRSRVVVPSTPPF